MVEDLKRRDFTINAMAYNSHTGFVDKFGGVEDLEKGIIRCVGNPWTVFTEDALRILRAIRFSAQLGFSIEERTYEAIKVIAPNMVHVSKERIQVELTKLLLSSIRIISRGCMRRVSVPLCQRNFTGLCCGFRGLGCAVHSGRSSGSKAWRAGPPFCGECSASQAAGILKDLKLDNDTSYRVRTLVEWQGKKVGAEDGGKTA